ncbi:DNA cytosine methyltransferase [Bacillus cereus]
MNRLRVFEAFAGVGTQSMALKRLEIDFEVVGIAEIDKFAIQSYMAIHGETKNYGDISKIDPTELPDMDLFTYSFPCQDLSISGKQRGMGEGTRSGLLYECEKVITTKKPKYLLLENVKNLVGKKFKPDFDKWLEWLESQGYSNYWQVLNAKDYGVPQNRERVFVVSILGEETYEFPNRIPNSSTLEVIGGVGKKNSSGEYHQTNRVYDSTGLSRTITANSGGLGGKSGLYKVYNDTYRFPDPFPLDVKLKDILEDEVEEKYFLSTKLLEGFTAHKKRHQEKGTGFQYNPRDVNKHASCLRANAALAPTDNTVIVETTNEKVLEKQREFPELILAGKLSMKGHDQINRVYDSEGLSPALTTMQGGHRHHKVIDYVDGEIRVREATKLGYKVAEEGDSINIEHPNSTTRRGRVGKQVAQTLTTSPQQVTIKDYRIRRLTPLECWRLMGIADEDFYKAKNSGISDSQLYKQAGNAIVVDVLVGIFGNLLK